MNNLSPGEVKIDSTNLYYLWLWQERDEAIKNLIYDYKNSGLRSLAWQLIFEALKVHGHRLVGAKHIIYPIKGINKSDHAYMLATALGKFFNCPVSPVLLESQKRENYRKLNKAQRKVARRAYFRGGVADVEGRVLFVDDVVTTGSTLKECIRAIKLYKNKVIGLSLAYRAK